MIHQEFVCPALPGSRCSAGTLRHTSMYARARGPAMQSLGLRWTAGEREGGGGRSLRPTPTPQGARLDTHTVILSTGQGLHFPAVMVVATGEHALLAGAVALASASTAAHCRVIPAALAICIPTRHAREVKHTAGSPYSKWLAMFHGPRRTECVATAAVTRCLCGGVTWPEDPAENISRGDLVIRTSVAAGSPWTEWPGKFTTPPCRRSERIHAGS